MNGNLVSGDVVAHKLIQDLLSLSKWRMAHLGDIHYKEAEQSYTTDGNKEEEKE